MSAVRPAQGMAAPDTTPPVRYVHERWTVRDGLPVNGVRRIIQGRDGYLWMATWDGLVRFDGVRFVIFNTGNTAALPSNRLVDLVPGADGALWIRTEQNHLVRFKDGVFTHFTQQLGLRDGSTLAVHVDAAGQVWLGTEDGVRRLVGDRFEPVAPSIHEAVVALLHARDGTLWIGTLGNGVVRVHGDTTERFNDARMLGSLHIFSIREDAAGTVWIGSETSLVRYRGGHLESGPPGRSPHLEVEASPSGEIWLGTVRSVSVQHDSAFTYRYTQHEAMHDLPVIRFHNGEGWYAVDDQLYRDGREVFRIPPEDIVGTVTRIYDVAWDHEGSIWVGTYTNGLYRLKPTPFTTYSIPEGLPDGNVTVLLQDRSGAIWIGTREAGLSRLDRGGIQTFPPVVRNNPSVIYSLMQDTSGYLWVGGGGARRCQLPVLACTAPELPTAQVYAMHQARDGTIWAGTSAGLFRRLPGGWQRMAEAALPPSSIVRAILESADGTLWMGTTSSGVLAWRDGRFLRVTSADGLPGDLIRALYEDPEGHLWVGTEGRGLARIALPAELEGEGHTLGATGFQQGGVRWRITTVRQRDGLFDEVIHRIIADGEGRLWMSTNRGLFWVRAADLDAFADGRVRRIWSQAYTERDGLRNREANGGSDPAGIRSRDGRIWFPTQDGAVVVDPARIVGGQAPPKVVVENVSTRRREIDPKLGPVELQPDERDFEVAYTALSFIAPQSIRFRYRLVGFSNEWTEVDERRQATFTQVPPGRYTFEVVASHGEGAWSDVGAYMPIRVVPRFYETRTAFWLLLLFMAGLAGAGYRWRVRRLSQRAEELGALVEQRTVELREREARLAQQNERLLGQAERLTQLDEAKSRLFANLSHEFRTPLTLIIGPLQSLLAGRHGTLPGDVRQQSELMLRSARRLLRLINQILDLTRLQAATVRLDRQWHDLVGFVRGTTAAFAPLAERRGFALGFHSDVESLAVEFDAEQLEKVVVNLLSNALKFTEAGGSVDVRVRRVAGGAEISVRDTGVGIGAEELPQVFNRFYQADASATRRYEGTGIGLALARELVQLHGGSIRVESTPGEGSTFVVTLPLGDPDAMRPDVRPGASGSLVAALEEPAPDEIEADEGDEDRTTVLVIDDNADVRAYVRSVLAGSYRMIEARDGVEGLERARADLPDLIVADVMMPGLDGLALARELKTDPMTDAIPVVLLTARAASEDQVAGFETGADAYLVKPFDPAVLEAQVANLLAQRLRLRERFQVGATVPPPPAAPAPSALDQRLRPLVEARLHDPGFSPMTLASAAGLSYHQLYRALRDELGTTPSRFIRTVRVECAAELLARRAGSITEIAYSVGFESLSYFSRAFRERYGCAPSEHSPATTM